LLLMPRDRAQMTPPDRTLRFALPLFGIALAISVFLAWVSLRAGAVPGCDGGSGCDQVLSSRWSRLFGLPVSLFAIPVYGALLVELMRRAPRERIYFSLALLVLGAAVWFVGVQAFVLKAFCPYCMVAHVAGATGAVLVIRRSHVPAGMKRVSIAGAIAAILVLGVAQAIAPGPSAIRVEIPGTNASVAATPAATPIAPPIPAAPMFSILGGQFRLDLTKVPVVGPVHGSRRVLKLFDYTCHHCRHLHHLLHGYMQTNEVTLVLLPMPLDGSCNPLVKKTQPDHVNACEYARLALAVFRAAPAKFADFSNWLFEPERPPSIGEARARAEEMAGAMAIASVGRNPDIEQLLQMSSSIYVTNSRAARSGRMPQLIFEHSAAIGAVNTMGQLEKILSEGFSPKVSATQKEADR
jgi:uncharacterized membrane protein